MNKKKYNQMINYAYSKFIEERDEAKCHINAMEFWFIRALKLEEPKSKRKKR